MPANQVQIRRDSNTNLNASTPASGELGWDTTNKRLRGGDGSTAGGIYIPNRTDLQNQSFIAVDAGGTADALTLTLPTGLVPSAYTKFQRFVFKATATNTTTATLNVNSLGAKTIKKMSTAGATALSGGEIYNGQVYAVVYDGTDMLLESVPVSSATGDCVLLATATASSSATLDFTSVITSTYNLYMFEFADIVAATNLTTFQMRTSTDNGSTYDSGASNYKWAVFYKDASINAVETATNSASATVISLTGTANVGNAAGEGISGRLYLHSPLGTAIKKMVSWNILMTDDSTNCEMNRGHGSREATADVDAVRFFMASGNITSGKIRCYGFKV